MKFVNFYFPIIVKNNWTELGAIHRPLNRRLYLILPAVSIDTMISVEPYSERYLKGAMDVWNQVVSDGVAFPQTDLLSEKEADVFFSSQSFTGVAVEDGSVLGLYILHPNNLGRCGHIANCSYAVSREIRGKHIGEMLVNHSLKMAHEKGFRLIQFNAVVASNIHAIHLYERCGFKRIGTVPGGFRMDDGTYSDIILFYHEV